MRRYEGKIVSKCDFAIPLSWYRLYFCLHRFSLLCWCHHNYSAMIQLTAASTTWEHNQATAILQVYSDSKRKAELDWRGTSFRRPTLFTTCPKPVVTSLVLLSINGDSIMYWHEGKCPYVTDSIHWTKSGWPLENSQWENISWGCSLPWFALPHARLPLISK